MLQRLIDSVYIRMYYRKKRKRIFLSDFKVSEWYAGLTIDDIYHYTMEIPINIGVIIRVRVVGADKIRPFLCENVRLDIDCIVDCKPIKDCTFEEFKQYYSELLLYIRAKGGELDIVRETKNHYYTKGNIKNI